MIQGLLRRWWWLLPGPALLFAPAQVSQQEGPGSPPRVGVGSIHHRSEQTFEGVLDQGDEWVFEFDHAGVGLPPP